MSTAALSDPQLCSEPSPACAVALSKTEVADVVVFRERIRQRALLIIETTTIAPLGVLLPTAPPVLRRRSEELAGSP